MKRPRSASTASITWSELTQLLMRGAPYSADFRITPKKSVDIWVCNTIGANRSEGRGDHVPVKRKSFKERLEALESKVQIYRDDPAPLRKRVKEIR